MGTGRRLLIIVLNFVLFWGVLPAGLVGAGFALDGWLGLPVPRDVVRGVGAGIGAAGLVFALWAIAVLRVKGKGLPISSLPPPELVPSGPYAWVRHPIYTGYVLLAGGGGLAAGSWAMALIVVPVVAVVWFATWVKLYEEPGLLRRFGNSYRVYAERTPGFLPVRPALTGRWLVLRLFRLFFRISVEGAENVPKSGPVILYSDHLCYLDFIFAHYATKRLVRIPVTAEVFRKPLQRAFVRMMGGVPTRRFCADPASVLALADELSVGGVVGIAIEGERSWTGEMSLPGTNVAKNILDLCARGNPAAGGEGTSLQVVPLAFNGAYRVWPRWANGADRSAAVRIRIGTPFDLRAAGEAGRTKGEDLLTACARVLRERVVALRLPEALLADPAKFPGSRPELALWKCPMCAGEETLALEAGRWLTCAHCNASWDCSGGDFTVQEPVERAGEKGTLAGWCRRAGCAPGDLSPGPVAAAPVEGGADLQPSTICAADCELREDPDARLTLQVLKSLGMGIAVLRSDGLEWKREGVSRRYRLEEIRTVTTERNDTLQLGIGRGVVQLVFPKASPSRWQRYVSQAVVIAGAEHREDG
jgi:1-acyl-sn-glycerol-3-phosphate acyltransferase